jgi:NTE family protein
MTVALVLQGGGSLSAGQVGMLRALGEAGIRPDLIVGSSAGALNAVAFAQDPTAAGLEELRQRWTRVHRHDVFPVQPGPLFAGLAGRSAGLVSPRRLRTWVKAGLHIRDLDDAVIPTAVVATDADSGETVVLSHGSAIDALLASTAIPGVFPPVRIGGRWLVDGGVGADIPLRQAEELGATLSYILPRAATDPNVHAAGALSALLRAGSQLLDRSSDVAVAAAHHEVRYLPAPTSLAGSPFNFHGTRLLLQDGYLTTRSWLATYTAGETHVSAPGGVRDSEMLGSGLTVTRLGQTAIELRDARGQLLGVYSALAGAPKLLGAWQVSSQPDADSRDAEPWAVAVGRAPEEDPVAVTFRRKQAGSRFLSSRPGVLSRFGDLWVAAAPGAFMAATAVSNTRHEALPVLQTTSTAAPTRAESTTPRRPTREVARLAQAPMHRPRLRLVDQEGLPRNPSRSST